VTISVLVPAYNEAVGLGASLTSIRAAVRAFEARGWTSELVVCDNNSSDGTAAVARAHGARVVFEPVNQISRARNAAAAAATGEWLVFVDADSHPSPALMSDVAEAIATGRCLAGGSTVVMDGGGRLGRVMVGAWNLLSRATRWAAGSFIFVESAAFRAVGGFSDELFASEEIDLFRRLKRAARRARRRIVILHRHPLATSGRKFELYSPGEIVGFVLRTMFTGGRTLRRADGCSVWYDGRR
jgi:glycosyltransferase involved in cell wall biosynthesis